MDGEINDQQAKRGPLRTRWTWTPALDRIFADIVVGQIQRGNQPNTVFGQKTWSQIREEFNRQTNLDFNNNQLRKHLDVLRARYHNLLSDYSQNDTIPGSCYMGFDLCDDIGVSLMTMCIYFQILVTKQYFKSSPLQAQSELEPGKPKACPIYQQFHTIFADTSLHGNYAQSSHYGELHKPAVISSLLAEVIYPNPIIPMAGLLAHNGSSTTQGNTADKKRKRPEEARVTHEKSQWNHESNNAMAGAILDMISSSKLREVTNSVIDEGFSIGNCVKALDEIEDMDDHLYYAALDLLENLTFRKMFISLKGSRVRLMWLQENCDMYTPRPMEVLTSTSNPL